jgi:cytochrome c peroxidase
MAPAFDRGSHRGTILRYWLAGMQIVSGIRYFLTLGLAAVLTFQAHKSTKRSILTSEVAVERQAPHARPVPAAGPMASPKSLKGIGVPVAATGAAVPIDNPQTPGKIALGERLFFDARLSVDGTVACSTCHDPALAFTDGKPVSIGVRGRAGQRNAPTILNALYSKTQFWDGRAQTLEDQAAFPVINPSEMGQPSLGAAVTRSRPCPNTSRHFAVRSAAR